MSSDFSYERLDPSFYDRLNVWNDEKSIEEEKTPISNINREILTKRANEIAQTLIQGGCQREEGYLKKLIGNYSDKGAAQLGGYAGTAASETYGSGIINKAVEFVCSKAIGSSKLITSGMQLAVTPKVLPYMTAFSSAAGGMALPAAVGLISMLYNSLLASGKYTIDTLPPPDQLLRYDSKEQAFFDALGNKLGTQELKDLQLLVHEFDLISKILASTRENVEGVFHEALNGSENFSLQNTKEIEEMINRLKEENRYGRDKILQEIHEFAKGSAHSINRTAALNQQHANDIQKTLDTILDKIQISSEAKYGVYYDEAKGSFYTPNWLASKWYRQRPDTLSVKLSEKLKPELAKLSKKVRELSGLLTEVSKKEFEEIKEKQKKITESFATLYSELAKHKNEGVEEAFSDSLLKVTKSLEIAKHHLAIKVE